MKKLLVLALIAIMSVCFLAGCGSFKCDICGKEKDGEKHTVEVLDEEVVMCDDCYKLGK